MLDDAGQVEETEFAPVSLEESHPHTGSVWPAQWTDSDQCKASGTGRDDRRDLGISGSH